jgi:hypothetical protein
VLLAYNSISGAFLWAQSIEFENQTTRKHLRTPTFTYISVPVGYPVVYQGGYVLTAFNSGDQAGFFFWSGPIT